MSTRRGEGWQCDHGAQYFHRPQSPVSCRVARWREAGAAARWSPRLRVLDGASTSSPVPIWRALGRAAHERTGPPAWALDLRTGGQRGCARRAADRWQLRSVESTAGWPGASRRWCWQLPAPRRSAPSGAACAIARGARREGSGMRGSRALMLRFATARLRCLSTHFSSITARCAGSRDSSKPGRGGTGPQLLRAAAWARSIDEGCRRFAELLLAAFVELGAPSGVECAPLALRRHRGGPRSGLCLGPRLRIGLCGDWLNGGRWRAPG